MRPRWYIAANLIEAGRVLIDKNFEFPDGEYGKKWLLILSDKLIENSYIYCLTTSQHNTYQRSYSDYIVTNDPALGNKTIIIEIERIDLISINLLKRKYQNNVLEIKAKIAPSLMIEILNKIQDSERIANYLKEWLVP